MNLSSRVIISVYTKVNCIPCITYGVRMAHNTPVDYCYLGKSGLKVSNVCLGSLTFQKIDEGAGVSIISPP